QAHPPRLNLGRLRLRRQFLRLALPRRRAHLLLLTIRRLGPGHLATDRPTRPDRDELPLRHLRGHRGRQAVARLGGQRGPCRLALGRPPHVGALGPQPSPLPLPLASPPPPPLDHLRASLTAQSIASHCPSPPGRAGTEPPSPPTSPGRCNGRR